VILVRLLTAADRVGLRALRTRALTEDPASFGRTAEEEAGVERLPMEASLEAPWPATFLIGAEHDGVLVGICGTYQGQTAKTRHTAEIVSVYVAPEARGLGIGAALVTEALARLAGAGIAVAKLSVAEESVAARRLYERCGFETYGREPAGYRWQGRDWTLLLMRRELTPPLR
jgi:ribosomal protein S18 acetylase RimI-like enzyme